MVTNQALATQNGSSIMEEVITKGDLAKLSPDQRAIYYTKVCESIGVNPLTKPFEYISLNNKLTLYATKTATDQLRTVRGVSVHKIDAETTPDGLRIVTAYARDAAGREDMDLGVVNVKGLQGEALANAYMKALTKAKRRVTLSICGLGWLDESELDAVPTARPAHVDTQTGEILDTPHNDSTPVVTVHPQDEERWEGGCTKKQLQQLNIIRQQKGVTPDGLKKLHGKASGKLLTETEAADLIAIISDYPDIVLDAREASAPMFDAANDPNRYTR
jgi:hypothetical protein